MTPMIDVTFLLLTFFMLASHFAAAEKTDVDLPKPDDNQAVNPRIKQKIIINVLYAGPQSEPALMLGPVPVASLSELAGRLEVIGRDNPGREVLLRADRRLGYGQVRRVMQVIAAENLTRMQVVTQLDEPQ